jgi:RNA polymerase sigma factor, sigma-70 family
MARNVKNKSTGQAAALVASAADQYGRALHRFLFRRLRSTDNLPDLAQEVYLRLLRVNNAEEIRDYKAYLYKVAAHVVHEYRLQARRDSVMFDSGIAEEAERHLRDDACIDFSEQLSTQRQLDNVLSQIQPMCRAVFLLQRCEGMSHAEVARELNLSEHTVKKYLFRALAALRAAQW